MKQNLFIKIRSLVAQIPKGKVSTYGNIAKMAGTDDARKTGWAIYNNQDPKIPCHRVVFKDGSLAEECSLGGWQEQKARLKKDGVIFKEEKNVDMKKCLWRPNLRNF
jgi:methylated-DNA-protein-cysteine methyltransferase-like protein